MYVCGNSFWFVEKFFCREIFVNVFIIVLSIIKKKVIDIWGFNFVVLCLFRKYRVFFIIIFILEDECCFLKV